MIGNIVDFENIKFEVGCDLMPTFSEETPYSAWARANGFITTRQFTSIFPPGKDFEKVRNINITHCMQDIFAKLAYEKMGIEEDEHG